MLYFRVSLDLIRIMVKCGCFSSHASIKIQAATRWSLHLPFVILSQKSIFLDAYVVPLTKQRVSKMKSKLVHIVRSGKALNITVTSREEELLWKQLLPALVECCRGTWHHGQDCEYRKQGKIPLSTAHCEPAICSCGEYQDANGFPDMRIGRTSNSMQHALASCPFPRALHRTTPYGWAKRPDFTEDRWSLYVWHKWWYSVWPLLGNLKTGLKNVPGAARWATAIMLVRRRHGNRIRRNASKSKHSNCLQGDAEKFVSESTYYPYILRFWTTFTKFSHLCSKILQQKEQGVRASLPASHQAQ